MAVEEEKESIYDVDCCRGLYLLLLKRPTIHDNWDPRRMSNAHFLKHKAW